MRFARSAKILRTQFDAAPFAAVFLCLLIFLLLGTELPVPGLHVNLQPPSASDLPGVSGPAINVAVDSQGRLYYENRTTSESDLKDSLMTRVAGISIKPTLIIHADKSVTFEQLARLTLLAREAGITNSLLATLPRLSDAPDQP